MTDIERAPAGYLDGVPLYADIYAPTHTPRPTRWQRFRWWIGGKRGPRPEAHRLMWVVHERERPREISAVVASHENCVVLLSGKLPEDCRTWQVHEVWRPSAGR